LTIVIFILIQVLSPVFPPI